MKIPVNGGVPVGATAANFCEDTVEKRSINSELWQACAGPLVNLPPVGTHVLYFPQGHSEQVAASMKRDVDVQIPSYPNLPSKLLCMLHNVMLHADPETDEVYAQMTLQPVPSIDKEALLRSDLATKIHKPQTEFFCKMLTASDTSTHGGFSVPRRAAEKIFPALDFTMQPPAQEIRARDLHDNSWTFRHIFRGQPKRHLLTTGWSLFVSGKRLSAGDSVLFIRDEKQQLLLGIRRANRQPPNLSSSVLSNDSMHIGILAAAAHADANKSPFTVFFNPRASPSEFVIPLARYYKAVFSSHISLGMRFRMMFETEDSGTRRYMGTITNVSDLDPIRWKNSQWRNLQVGWDESTTGEKRSRVSVWEIEPVTAPFFFCPPPFIRPKRARQPGLLDDEVGDVDSLLKRTIPWSGGDEMSFKDPQPLPGLSLVQWITMQQNQNQNLNQNPSQILPNYINPGEIAFSSPQINTNTQLQNLNLHQLSRQNHLLNQIPPSDPIFKPQNLLTQQFQRQQQQEMMGGLMGDSKILEKLQHQHHQSLLFQQPPQIPTNRISTPGAIGPCGVQSAVTDDVPSCSTSPSTNNCVQLTANGGPRRSMDREEEMVLGANGFKSMNTVTATNTANIMMDLPSKSDFRPLGTFGQNPYSNIGGGGLMDYMETSSSSATSASLSQNDATTLLQSFNQQPAIFRGHESMDDGRLRMPLVSESLVGQEMVDSEKNFNFFDMSGFENYRDARQDLPSSMAAASQSFGAPEMSFHSVDSTLNDDSFMNMGAWPPPAPQLSRMRTFTKVYKRGAVGRSIDMSRYSGYEELKQDLGRRFGMEGQLEDPQRMGWKLVYLDHENDVLLVGDDPWEEFVSCVRCIKILSPQEVEQMSLDGDFGLQTQACSSSEAGNA